MDDPRRVGVGFLLALAAIVALYIAYQAPGGLPGQSHYTLTAQLDDLDGLGKGSDVRIAGNRVGQVLDPRRSEQGYSEVTLQLDPDVGPLPADSTMKVRPKGLLGAQYADLQPGDEDRTIADGGTLGLAATSASTQTDDVLDTFDAKTRKGLQGLVGGLGGGLAGRGEGLNEALETSPDLVEDAGAVSKAINDREGAAERLIGSGDELFGVLDPIRDQLADGFSDFRDAAVPFGEEAESIRRTLDVAPGSLASIESSLVRLEPFLASAIGFARATAEFTGPAPRALDAATELLDGAQGPLVSAEPLVDDLQDTVDPVLSLTAAVGPVSPRLGATLELLRTPVNVLGDYHCELEGMARNWRSFTNYAYEEPDGPLGPITSLRVMPALASFAGVDTPSSPLVSVKVDQQPPPCYTPPYPVPEDGR